MNILYLDSATEACTCSVSTVNGQWDGFEYAPRGHAQMLLPMAEALMHEAGIGYADLDLIGYGRGPGSFTGVRIGMGAAMGIASALNLPMAGISSLDVLAQAVVDRAAPGDWIHAAIDARMGEVYYAGYIKQSDGELARQTEEMVTKPSQLALQAGVGIGTGFGAYPELLGDSTSGWLHVDGKALPHARDGIRVVQCLPETEWGSALTAEPVYLRNNVAQPPKPRNSPG